MGYGELGSEALAWSTRFVFGLDPASMPARIVVTPLKVEEYFDNFQALIRSKDLTFERITGVSRSSFLVWKGDKQVLFCEGDVGASNFADSSYILCHCRNVEEIIFAGTGGGIGENVESGDVNVPPLCIRLDKVLEILLPPEAPAKADPDMVEKLKGS